LTLAAAAAVGVCTAAGEQSSLLLSPVEEPVMMFRRLAVDR
jgi:hypothetical protein